MEALIVPIAVGLIVFLITVAISRWIFRINKIVNTLEEILRALVAGLDIEVVGKGKDKT
jgi:hypothetical protein